LTEITVTDHEKSPFYAKTPDTGIQMTGRFTDTSESSSLLIGLGKDTAGDTFKGMLMQSVQNAKK
jgi:hypothetical protein